MRTHHFSHWLVLPLLLLGLVTARAGFLIEVDIDGLDDGVLTYNPHFSFGGDTTSASQSAPSAAFGMTGGDSIYGGNGSAVDTYVFTYDPATDIDNLPIPAGTDLGGGILGTGLAGGNPGIYAVFATWPFTENVSGGDTSFTINTLGDSFSTSFSQNGLGNDWIKVGEISWSSGPITLTQESGAATFVSMRSSGVLFEPVPEPTVTALFGVALLAGLLRWRWIRRP